MLKCSVVPPSHNQFGIHGVIGALRHRLPALTFEISKFEFYVMIGLAMKTLDPKAEYIVKNGKATAVILPLEQYTELLEDLQDLAVIARRKNEPTIPLAEVKARLRRNGALRR